METKYKEVNSENKKKWQLFKKIKRKQPGKYYENARVKIGGVNSCERYVRTR